MKFVLFFLFCVILIVKFNILFFLGFRWGSGGICCEDVVFFDLWNWGKEVGVG